MYAFILAAMLAIPPAAHRPIPADLPVIYTFEEPNWYVESVAGTSQITAVYGTHGSSVALAIEGNGTGLLAGIAVLGKDAPGLFSMTPGQTYPIGAWVNADAATDENTFAQISISSFLASGTPMTIRKSDLHGSGWQYVDLGNWPCVRPDLLPFLPEDYDAPSTVKLTLGVDVVTDGGPAIGRWLIGQIVIVDPEEEDMTKRREIREALVTRIGTVTTGNGYAMSLGSVATGPVRMDDASYTFPLVAVRHGEEVKTMHTLGRKQSVMTFYVGVACKRTDTADPDDTADDACGEIEKAVELFASGSFLGLGYITNVFVAGIDPEELTPEVALDLAAWTLAIEVTYTHDRRAP